MLPRFSAETIYVRVEPDSERSSWWYHGGGGGWRRDPCGARLSAAERGELGSQAPASQRGACAAAHRCHARAGCSSSERGAWRWRWQAARQLYQDAKIWVVYQPHTYSRLVQFYDDFITAFSGADRVIITEVRRGPGGV